jgi:hypothetical protein
LREWYRLTQRPNPQHDGFGVSRDKQTGSFPASAEKTGNSAIDPIADVQ